MEKYLGKKATDTVTGFTGIITGYCGYITGCEQYLVQPPVKEESKDWVESKWFDVDRLSIDKNKSAIILESKTVDGADKQAPIK